MFLKVAAFNIVFLTLIVFGPKFLDVDNGWLYRILLLSLLPVSALLAVQKLLKIYRPKRSTEIKIEGLLAGVVGVVLMTYAIYETSRLSKSSGSENWTMVPLVWMAALGLIFLTFGKIRQLKSFRES